MILEGANCSFGSVTPVDVWWHQLECAVVVGDRTFEGRTYFVVEDVLGGCVVARLQMLVGRVVGCNAVGVAF